MAECSLAPKKLKYHIYYSTSFASNFEPENIMEDKPQDQGSRWSSDSNYRPQYLILKLESPALVDSITFGKFHKTHVCSLKKVKVFIGMTDACNTEVFDGEVRNSPTAETFDIKRFADGQRIPCQYIKLAPFICWGPSFNLSIWYVALTGLDEPKLLAPIVKHYQEYEERQVIKLCLKHFRQRNYVSSFLTLSEETSVSLEDPLMTELYHLVTDGYYAQTEQFMQTAVMDGHLREFLLKQSYQPVWTTIDDYNGPRPGMRGGHQMCVDPNTQTVYLLGGWDGHHDMADFWYYHVPSEKWTCLSNDTSKDGGPSPRSCHKMVLDYDRRELFVLGRYVDTQTRSVGPLNSDFYLYDLNSATWTLIMEDTASMGGPQLLFDHQMCFDALKRTLYVFGGRVLTPPFWPDNSKRSSTVCELKFSGLYSYDVATSTWTLLFDDWTLYPHFQSPKHIRSRVGHSMLFHTACRKLFIFGGQRSKSELHDMLTYNVDSGELCTVTEGSEDSTPDADYAPSSKFTQRSTIDPDLNEIYLLSGLSKDKEKRSSLVQYSLWVYSIIEKKWTCIHKNDSDWCRIHQLEPCPRFAHQFIYDPVHKVHYLFGGNPGRISMPKLRLDDFWTLHLSPPDEQRFLKKIIFLIRKHKFEEMAMEDSMKGLEYLQTAVYEIINHEDKDQTREFQALTSLLFKGGQAEEPTARSTATLRDSLYNQLLKYFPQRMVQPEGDLVDVLSTTNLES